MNLSDKDTIKLDPEKNGRRDSFRKILFVYLCYSILFAIVVIGVFNVFILDHKSFIQGGDGYKQGYFWVVEYHRQLQDLFSGKGLSMWSWSRGPGMDIPWEFYMDPFHFIAALFPQGYIELGYTISTILKLYFGGITFIMFCSYVGLGRFQRVMGGLFYAFSGHFITVALVHSTSMISMYLFPLLMLSAEKIFRKGSPVLFSLTVAFYMAANIYYAYMGALAVILYIIVRYFAYYEGFSIGNFARVIGGFLLYGICGIMISGFASLTTVLVLMDASSGSASDARSLFFGRDYYYSLGEMFVGRGGTTNYYIVGLSVMALVLIPVALRRFSVKNTPLIMTILMTAAMMFPMCCSAFNGFGYPTLRWVFVLIFFAVWCAVEQLDRKTVGDVSSIILMVAALAAICIATIGLGYMGYIDFSDVEKVFIPIQLFAGALLIPAVLLYSRSGSAIRASQTIIAAILVISLSLSWTYAFRNDNHAFMRNNGINRDLERSVQRAGPMIEDDGFFRIDQVDSVLYHNVNKTPPNENLFWRTRNLYAYNSSLPEKYFEFNRLVGNNRNYSQRVYVLSNDNRMGLDQLMGVRYFLGDDEKNKKNGSDAYAGYPFDIWDIVDGVHVYKNKYDTSLGYVFEKCLPESEFMKLGRLEREQALIQAAVLPDDRASELPDDRVIKASDIDVDVKSIPYRIIASDGITITENVIKAAKKDASFTVEVKDVSSVQMAVSFDGLMRDSSDGVQSQPFAVICETEKLSNRGSNPATLQTIPGIRDYDLNMGYYDSFSGKIRVSFTRPGTYTYEDFRISGISAENFDRYASAMEMNMLDVRSFDEHRVKGKIATDKGGILFLSMPENRNWDMYVGGKKVEAMRDVDIAFWGGLVPKGEHEVELVYTNRTHYAGMAVSAAGIILLLLFRIISRRRCSAGI